MKTLAVLLLLCTAALAEPLTDIIKKFRGKRPTTNPCGICFGNTKNITKAARANPRTASRLRRDNIR